MRTFGVVVGLWFLGAGILVATLNAVDGYPAGVWFGSLVALAGVVMIGVQSWSRGRLGKKMARFDFWFASAEGRAQNHPKAFYGAIFCAA